MRTNQSITTLVGEVSPESPASGLIFELDGITEVNGERVPSDLQAANEAIRGPLGEAVGLTLLRRCSRLIPPVRIPVTVRRGPPPRHVPGAVRTDADYLWQLGRITRQHIIDTSYAERDNDPHSVRRHLERLIALETTLADDAESGGVSPALRSAVRRAIQFAAAVCAITEAWDGVRDSNLQRARQAVARMGLELMSGSGDGGNTLGDLAAGVLGRALAQAASHSLYQSLRERERPHAKWRSLLQEGDALEKGLPPAPFTWRNSEFMTDPHWQFVRRRDLPFDQAPGLGNDILDFPPVVSTQRIALRPRGNYARLKITDLEGKGRLRFIVDLPTPEKYFFVLLEAEKGILGVTQNPSGYCTWASRHDAFYANNGMIGRESRSYSGQFDFSIVHRELPMLGAEGGASSGTVYFWTSDTPEFPAALRDAPVTHALE